MKIINCTPHPINIIGDNNEVIASFPKGDIIPRLTQKTVQVGGINGIPLTSTNFSETQNMPRKLDGVVYIVSRLVLEDNRDRNDLLVPNEIVRDDDGNIIGCRSLSIN